MVDVSKYTGLITAEHNSRPNFIAVIKALCQPFVDQQNVGLSIPALYDVDTAIGAQLDTVGEWIGASRDLVIPLTGVYFAFDTAGVGFDQGTWKGPFDPTTQLDVLPDSYYRLLLLAKIANNQWDGTVPGAYKFMESVFPGNTFFIQDLGNMTMIIGVINTVPLDAVTTALLEGGYFNIRPAGVQVIDYAVPSVAGDPCFGFDAENSTIAGFDHGAWATLTIGN